MVNQSFVGTALVAVRLVVRTGIHPEGFILKDKPCPYAVPPLRNDFFNTPLTPKVRFTTMESVGVAISQWSTRNSL
jgi:hypothetical protein